MTPPPSLQALFSLLEDEKLALLSGEYHMLEEFSQAKQRHLEALDLQHVPRRQRWSRNFGPVVKVDRMMREVIQNEETKEPFA